MSFAWPLALLSLLVVPAAPRRLLVEPAAAAQAGGSLLERRAAALGAADSGSGGSGTSRSRSCSSASSRSRWPPAGRTSCADVPFARTSIILALDVSRSMCSTDVQPNRLAVAQEAARTFVENQPKGVRMGLVVFSGFAELTVPPTTDRKALDRGDRRAHDGARHRDRLGDAEGARRDRRGEPGRRARRRRAGEPARHRPATKPGANGFVPDIVVLLTDGANNRGIEPLDAVPYAVERRVRVYPIGFGTTNPAPPVVHARSSSAATSSTRAASAAAAGSAAVGGGGFGRFLVADEPTLKAVAEQTGGTYHGAKDADQLRKVFTELPKEVATQKRPTEITWMFAALGALLAAAAVAASMRWSPYP